MVTLPVLAIDPVDAIEVVADPVDTIEVVTDTRQDATSCWVKVPYLQRSL